MAYNITLGRFFGPPGGTIETYQAGTLTPLATYTTAAGTTPNPTTIAIPASGYVPVWGGAGLSYRFIVKDSDGVTVYDQDNISDYSQGVTADVVALEADLSSSASALVGAGMIGYNAERTYAAGTVGAKLRESLSVRDFGAVGDGLRNDYNDILTALSVVKNGTNKRLLFPSGTYFLGDWGTSSRIFDLTTYGDGITVETEGDVEFVVNTTANANPVVFYMRSNSHWRFGRMKFRDLNYSRTAGGGRGCIGFTLDAFSADWGNVTFDGVYATECYTAFEIATKSATRVRNIHIKQLHAYKCNRGFNAQDQGDNVVIDNLYAEQCERAYFVYGVTGHRANIFTRNNFGTTGTVNIARAVGGYNTTAIDINYVSRDCTVDLCHVLIDHIDLLGGEITGIRVNVDIRGSAAYDPVRIVNYTGSGGSETSGSSSNITGDIELSGSCDTQARDVEVVASYGSRRRLRFRAGRCFEMDSSVATAFDLADGALYAPIAAAWSAPTPPAIGNGSLVRTHSVTGNLCTVTYTLTAAGDGTTTFGTGDWTFTAPIAAYSTGHGAAYIFDSGTGYHTGTARIAAGSSTINVYSGASAANAVRSNTPMTWAANDVLSFTMTYQIA